MPRAARRLLDIIETFARVRRPLNVSELAREIGIPVSTCHGLVKALESRGYLIELRGLAGYYPTQRIEHLGREINRYDVLPAWLPPRLAELRDQSQETVLVAQRAGRGAIYTEMVESNQSLRFIVKVGDTRPLHSTAVGQALLSVLPPAEREATIAQLQLDRRTPATKTSRRALKEALRAGIARGWFATEGDYFSDIGAIAVPVQLGPSFVAVAIAGPLPRMRAAQREHAKALQTLRADVERLFAGA
ncbi:MAG: IclR family transcriptional regulator [Burkholderiaceae bacterium]